LRYDRSVHHTLLAWRGRNVSAETFSSANAAAARWDQRKPVRMRPPAYAGAERRDVARREALARRLAIEFDEMGGLRLSIPQAARLLCVAEPVAARILQDLVDQRILHCNPSNFYVRADRPGS
jgi:hypothetical protein